LFVTTEAGQLRREVTLMQWDNRFTAPMPMAIDEELDIALVALYGLTNRFIVLYAFSLRNGTALYNVSLGLSGIITDLTRSVNHTALLTLPGRILVLDMATGSQLRSIDAPANVRFSSVAYDGQRWYFGQSISTNSGPVNGSVLIWDEVAQREEALLVVSRFDHRQTWLTGQPAELHSVLLTEDGRIFALDRARLVAYWEPRKHSTSTPATINTVTASASWLHRSIASKLSAGTE